MAETLGVPNRGAKPDPKTAVGSLGWIRKTTIWASLIEVCFLTNPEDIKILHGTDGYEKAARGIVNGIREIFGVPKLPNLPSPEVGEIDREKIKLQIIELVNQL